MFCLIYWALSLRGLKVTTSTSNHFLDIHQNKSWPTPLPTTTITTTTTTRNNNKLSTWSLYSERTLASVAVQATNQFSRITCPETNVRIHLRWLWLENLYGWRSTRATSLEQTSSKENVGSCCGTKTMAKAMLKMPLPAVCPPGETSEKRIYFVSKIDLYNLHIYRNINSPENFLLKSAEILGSMIPWGRNGRRRERSNQASCGELQIAEKRRRASIERERTNIPGELYCQPFIILTRGPHKNGAPSSTRPRADRRPGLSEGVWPENSWTQTRSAGWKMHGRGSLMYSGIQSSKLQSCHRKRAKKHIVPDAWAM